jgi:hypothetical protein
VLQSALRRTLDDVERANRLSARVRICKGAYLEPRASRSRQGRRRRNYVAGHAALMSSGRYPGIATHDERSSSEAKRFAKDEGIAPDRFEFQMLYGVRRDLQEAAREGRLPHARVRPLRHAVVSVPHAPARRAAREHRLHGGQHRARGLHGSRRSPAAARRNGAH